MFKFDEKSGESRLKAYQRKIADRKQQQKIAKEEYSDSYLSDNCSDTNEESFTTSLTLKFDVDNKIESICTIDKEYKDTMALAKLSEERARKALMSADKASEKSFWPFATKKNVEALQEAQKDQALLGEANTQAITKSLSLEKRIVEAIQALFALGISSIAANRTVYRQLELKMKGASEQELSDLAKEELLGVMRQLNEQQDLMAKQKRLSKQVHEQNALIKNQAAEIEELKSESKNKSSEIDAIKEELKTLRKEKPAPDNDYADSPNNPKEEIESESPKEKSKWFRKKH